MRRHGLTKTSFILVSLACMALLGEFSFGAKIPPISTSRPHTAETPHIVDGSKVTLQYVARVPDSTGIDYGNISEFIQGRHEIFPALEREVVGMRPGEGKSVRLSPEEGFGPHDDEKKLNIPKTLLPLGAKKGDILQNDVGELATVADLSDTNALLDYNHPLAGKPLVVEVKILKVENP